MRTILITSLVVLSLTVTTQAQESLEKTRFAMTAPGLPFHQAAGVHHYRHASTIQQAYLDGMANLIVARSQANYYNGLTRLTMTQVARNQAVLRMEARQAKVQARENYRQRQEQQQLKRIERNQRRRAEREALMAKANVNWPEALAGETYQGKRLQIEVLIGKQTTLHGKRAAEVSRSVQTAVKSLANKVKADETAGRISETDAHDARQFLIGLYKSAPVVNRLQMIAAN